MIFPVDSTYESTFFHFRYYDDIYIITVYYTFKQKQFMHCMS